MRYFSYIDISENEDYIVRTVSEEGIRKEYYPYWYDRMCQKYGKNVVDSTYSFEDCLEDWVVVNWAWEGTDK